MRVFLLSFGFLTIASGAFAQSSADSLKHCVGVDIRYDKVEGETSLEVDGESLPKLQIELSLHASSPGRTLRGATRIRAFFVSSGEDWSFLRAHALTLLLDDKTRLQIATEHDGSVRQSGGVYENVIATFTPAQARLVGAAKKVEGRLGTYEIALSPKHLAGFRAAAQSVARGDGVSYRYACEPFSTADATR